MAKLFALFLLFSTISSTLAFVSNQVSVKNEVVAKPHYHATLTQTLQRRPLVTGTALREKEDNSMGSLTGVGRGNYILGLSFLVCLWFFTIPPEFRRTHFCTTAGCVQNRAYCYDCLTFTEWKDGIAEYYKNGGGVQFDFSIDPATTQFWADTLGSS